MKDLLYVISIKGSNLQPLLENFDYEGFESRFTKPTLAKSDDYLQVAIKISVQGEEHKRIFDQIISSYGGNIIESNVIKGEKEHLKSEYSIGIFHYFFMIFCRILGIPYKPRVESNKTKLESSKSRTSYHSTSLRSPVGKDQPKISLVLDLKEGIQKNVIILGKDTEPEIHDLIKIQNYLKTKNYNALLIKQIPDIDVHSNEEKVRLWVMLSKFVVMHDANPSGHIFEYHIVRDSTRITAILRKKNTGSTFMIGDHDILGHDFMKTFEFNQDPVERLDDVIKWAEKYYAKRAEEFNEKYHWRK